MPESLPVATMDSVPEFSRRRFPVFLAVGVAAGLTAGLIFAISMSGTSVPPAPASPPEVATPAPKSKAPKEVARELMKQDEPETPEAAEPSPPRVEDSPPRRVIEAVTPPAPTPRPSTPVVRKPATPVPETPSDWELPQNPYDTEEPVTAPKPRPAPAPEPPATSEAGPDSVAPTTEVEPKLPDSLLPDDELTPHPPVREDPF
jgi:outer membrane biosynthesis protein TonB